MNRLLLSIAIIPLLAACADKRPNVVLETTLGAIEIEVYQDKAPYSATDFLYYVDEKLYDGQGFYRSVTPETDPRDMGMSLIQGGRLDTLAVTAGITHERTSETGLSNIGGVVSIARDEPGSGSAAFFFINIGDNSFLDTGGSRNPDGAGYATFGRVVNGMDTVRAIQSRPTGGKMEMGVPAGQILQEPVIITRAYRK